MYKSELKELSLRGVALEEHPRFGNVLHSRIRSVCDSAWIADLNKWDAESVAVRQKALTNLCRFGLANMKEAANRGGLARER
jgi:hypothetical protein